MDTNGKYTFLHVLDILFMI